MKKSVIFLLAAVLLAWTAPATQAQSSANLSYSDASFLLQKTLGDWQVTKSNWNPEKQEMTKVSGKATYTPSTKDVSVQERAEIVLKDGTSQTEEGTLRYVKSRQQFEYVKTDPATGKETILFTGYWYPDFRTILLTAVSAPNNKNAKPDQWRYVFQENGTFTKMVHQANTDGKMILIDQYQFIPTTSSTTAVLR